jgi:signal transduction histidine kinase/ActR/RegA family two-component response regulator
VLGVDSETDYDRDGAYLGEREQRTPIGEAYEVDDGELASLRQVMAGEAVFQADIYTDRWGTWVSAFAPIRGLGGRPVAVLGVDYDARSWVRTIALQRSTVLGTFLALLLLIGGGAALSESNRSRATRHLLAEHNQQLELANQELRRANEQAMAASAAKTQFLANTSHELRTPLTAILGFAELLLEGGPTDPQWREHAETIRRSGQHLLTIVADVLDLAKSEAGVLEVHASRCSPRAIGRDVVSMLATSAAKKGLQLHFEVAADVPETFLSDPDRLRQILVNLVGNAVKFTERGHVKLDIVRAPHGEWVHFAVSDTGVGIAPEQQARLFQPFSQIDASLRRRHGGTGLGLAISRRFARLLGGELSLTSVVGQGTTFRLELPCPVETAPAEQATPVADVPAKGAASQLRGRVLLAEDGPDNQRLLTHLLRRFGLEVEVVENGRLAVERMATVMRGGSQAPIDLVLMDMQMPELDGYEATRQLRGLGCGLPIVAITAHATTADRDHCTAAGCDDYVSKPVDRRLLLDTLRKWLLPHS